MTITLSDSRAVEILRHHCDPKIFPTEEDMLRGHLYGYRFDEGIA